jgi:hypothetical protein
MIAPGNSAITIILALSIVLSSAYAIGRVHQRYRNGGARDTAYRNGYDKASHSILDVVATARRAVPAAGGRQLGSGR